jgi:3-dehydroquinate synthase
MLSGLAEVIKSAVIANPKLFDFIEKNLVEILEKENDALEHIICESAKIKAEVVEEDEKETKGVRTILNFGHTIGHAIETASGYSEKFTHGEVISFGMICATEIALKLGLCSKKTLSRLESLLSRVGLPLNMQGLSVDKIMKACIHDKKFISGKNRLVLPIKIGRVKVYEDLDESIISAVLKERLKQ